MRRAALAALIALAGAACGGRAEVYEVPPEPRTAGTRALPLPEPVPATPAPVAQTSGSLIGTLRFRILDRGFIQPDPAWVAANIASGTVPIVGTVACHRLMFPQLRAALAETEERDLAGLLRPGDYGGCYVPRFVDRDPAQAAVDACLRARDRPQRLHQPARHPGRHGSEDRSDLRALGLRVGWPLGETRPDALRARPPPPPLTG